MQCPPVFYEFSFLCRTETVCLKLSIFKRCPQLCSHKLCSIFIVPYVITNFNLKKSFIKQFPSLFSAPLKIYPYILNVFSKYVFTSAEVYATIPLQIRIFHNLPFLPFPSRQCFRFTGSGRSPGGVWNIRAKRRWSDVRFTFYATGRKIRHIEINSYKPKKKGCI